MTATPTRSDAPYVNVLDPDFYVDPWDAYRWLRDEAPCFWDPVQHLWVVTRYDDVMTVLQNYSAARTPAPEQLAVPGMEDFSPVAELMVRQRRHGFSRDVGNVRIAHQHKAEDIRARLRNDGNPLRILERHGKDEVGLADGPLKRRLFSSGVSTQQREAGAVRRWKQLAERRLLGDEPKIPHLLGRDPGAFDHLG